MKIFLTLMMMILTSCTSSDEGNEDYDPYPGGEKKENPREG